MMYPRLFRMAVYIHTRTRWLTRGSHMSKVFSMQKYYRRKNEQPSGINNSLNLKDRAIELNESEKRFERGMDR